ncbi:MAG TPA: sigma-54 factor interaction domain-containing protein, partial [Candidatus Hydrogenedentes bacterium]|nr:sigma-54 factor interaction domain-containing protein [Candidatus Hydrogenedentota bacterium]
MRVLLSFVGSHDPTTSSVPDGNTIDGPILTLVKHCPCDRVVLLSTRDMHDRGDTLLAMLQERLPALDAVNLTCPLPDPTDHLAILRLLRKTLKEESRGGDCFAGVASGTPAMHACWLLIAASGEFPLKLLQLRPERFVTAEHPLITIIDPMHSEFPRVLARFDRFKAKQAEAPDLARMQEQAGIVGSHPALRRELEKAVIYARSKDSVLILGESGTGKELVAKFIHLCSGIRGEFIALNCGGLSENLVDSELFGYKKGAFTGAEKDREGLFVRAKGGTLFLDEIGDMPLPLQVKLLRALQEKKIRPVGADKEVPVDARVLAATNVN